MNNLFKHLFTFLFFCFATLNANAQQVNDFISITKVQYNEETATIKFVSRVNSAHLYSAINSNEKARDFNVKLENYIKQRIKLIIDGSNKNIIFSGSKPNNSVIWIYYEVPTNKNMKTLTIYNKILLDSFSKQKNIVTLQVKNQRKTATCQAGSDFVKVNF